jgi:hypothetical protein
MSREAIRSKIRQKADLRGLQNEESVPISLKERYEGTAVGGAVYHNPKFTMDLVQPVGRKVGGRRLRGGMDATPSPPSKSAKPPPVQREKRTRRATVSETKDEDEDMFKTPEKKLPKAREAKKEEKKDDTDSESEVEGEVVEFKGKGAYRGGAKKAEKLGRAYMEKMMEFDPEMKKLVGSGLFDKFVKGLSEFAKGAVYPLKAIAKVGDIVSKASKLLEGVDDPQFAKDLGIGLKKKGGRARIQSPLQIVHPNVKGAGMNTKDFVDVPLQQQRTNVRGGIKMTIKDIEKAIPMPKRGSGMTSEREQERKGGRKTSSWIQFVKQYAKENNMKYSDALKEAGKHYKK